MSKQLAGSPISKIVIMLLVMFSIGLNNSYAYVHVYPVSKSPVSKLPTKPIFCPLPIDITPGNIDNGEEGGGTEVCPGYNDLPIDITPGNIDNSEE